MCWTATRAVAEKTSRSVRAILCVFPSHEGREKEGPTYVSFVSGAYSGVTRAVREEKRTFVRAQQGCELVQRQGVEQERRRSGATLNSGLRGGRLRPKERTKVATSHERTSRALGDGVHPKGRGKVRVRGPGPTVRRARGEPTSEYRADVR